MKEVDWLAEKLNGVDLLLKEVERREKREVVLLEDET